MEKQKRDFINFTTHFEIHEADLLFAERSPSRGVKQINIVPIECTECFERTMQPNLDIKSSRYKKTKEGPKKFQ